MTTLVIVENDNKDFKPSVLNTVSAASKLNSEIHLLVLSSACEGVVQKCKLIKHVSKIFFQESQSFDKPTAEDIADAVLSLASNYDNVLAPSNSFGKNFMPRVAAKMDLAQISDVIEILSADTFVRPIYAGNAISTIQTSDSKKIITVRTTAFDPVDLSNEEARVEIEEIRNFTSRELSKVVKIEFSKSERPELTSADIIVSGGRGLGNGENFKILDALADKLGAAVGASRAAVDSGFVPNDYQVGQTGKIVAPQLYIAVGISGAIQHLAGMKDSKVIVAINKDEEAPIFEVADYGLVADLFDVVPELTNSI